MKHYLKLLVLLLLFCDTLSAQNQSIDPIIFHKAQNKFSNCNSGIIDFKIHYVTDKFDYTWLLNMYFFKKAEKEYYFYIKAVEDSFINEYLFINDTLFVVEETNQGKIPSKQYTTKPLAGNIRKIFIELIRDYKLNAFLTYETVKMYDTVWTSNKLVVIGESINTRTLDDITNKQLQKIVIDKETNNLILLSVEAITYSTTELMFRGWKEFSINSIELFEETNEEIEYFIYTKYNEISSLVNNLNLSPDK